MLCLSKNRSDIVVLCRGQGEDRVWAVHNMTNSKLTFCIDDSLDVELKHGFHWIDIINGTNYLKNQIDMKPYSVYWLMQKK